MDRVIYEAMGKILTGGGKTNERDRALQGTSQQPAAHRLVAGSQARSERLHSTSSKSDSGSRNSLESNESDSSAEEELAGSRGAVATSSSKTAKTRFGNVKVKKPLAKNVDRKGRQIFCRNCGTSETPQWRSGPAGPRTLCNACGVKFKKGMPLQLQEGSHGVPSGARSPHSSQDVLVRDFVTKKPQEQQRSCGSSPTLKARTNVSSSPFYESLEFIDRSRITDS